MKVQADGKELYEILPWEKKLLENDLISETLQEDCERRLEWVMKHKIEQCWMRFEKEWMKILREDPEVSSIPVDKESFINLVLSRPDYKNRSKREEERELARKSSEV